MRYAIDIHATEDWGDGPVNWDANGYDFEDYDEACQEATRLMRAQILAGANPEWVGAYVISDERNPASDDPVVEELITPFALGWV